jgi:hypothetical protein
MVEGDGPERQACAKETKLLDGSVEGRPLVPHYRGEIAQPVPEADHGPVRPLRNSSLLKEEWFVA